MLLSEISLGLARFVHHSLYGKAGAGGPSGLIHDSGYFSTLMTPRREVGVNVHYAFGAR